MWLLARLWVVVALGLERTEVPTKIKGVRRHRTIIIKTGNPVPLVYQPDFSFPKTTESLQKPLMLSTIKLSRVCRGWIVPMQESEESLGCLWRSEGETTVGDLDGTPRHLRSLGSQPINRYLLFWRSYFPSTLSSLSSVLNVFRCR